jgi:glucose/arabinose dehydrogenase
MIMNAALFLSIFLLSLAATSLVIVRPKSNAVAVGNCVVAFGLLTICFISLGYMADGENIAAALWSGSAFSDRTRILTSASASFAGLLAGIGLRVPTDSKLVRYARWGGLLAAVASLGLLAAKDVLSPYLANPNSGYDQSLIQLDAAEGWAVRKVIDLSLSPTSIAVLDDNRLVVTGYSGAYMQNGSVGLIELSGQGPARFRSLGGGMTRPHGVAVLDGDIYVSRSGQYAKAVNGSLVNQDTGAITKLEDIRGDGSFQFFTDVVSGLPGAQLPDPLHQNNGIAFGADGSLFITVGVPTDHQVPITETAGTILRCNADGSGLEVYAEGFRNPFGICTNHEGQVFCTDNDAVVDENGDKLFLVQQGGNHGHPYNVLEGVRSNFVPPLKRLLSAQGIVYVEPSFNGLLANNLLIASYAENAIQSVSGFGSGETVSVKFLAKVPMPTDVCVTAKGRIFAVSYSEKALFEIIPVTDS